MGDAVTARILSENRWEAIMCFTNISDGTGEASIVKVDVSALADSPNQVAIKKVQWTTSGIDLLIEEAADTNVVLLALGSVLAVSASGTIDFAPSALRITEAAGWDGDLAFTVTGGTAGAGDSYTVVLHLEKIYLES